MHLTVPEAERLATAVVASCADLPDREVMIAPPFTALAAVAEVVRNTPVLIAGQNAAWEKQGAFTGEISPVMLREVGASMVIIGHSERRHIFGESNQMVNRRLRGALQFGLIPVLCVGETLADREEGKAMPILEQQVREGLAEVDAEAAARVVIAYEPVWAIGTGRTATGAQAQEAHAFIRNVLARVYEKKLADEIRILYGGSVKPENIDSLMAEPDIDGALVGGAALQSESFDRIVHFL